MQIELSRPFALNGRVDEHDVRQMKKALNRLGYYQPYEKAGITDIADTDVFEALKAFQKDRGLPRTGAAKPGDETVKILNEATSKAPDGKYIWRTVEDDKVRSAHARYNRAVRDWSDAPDPGDDFNCRCWAEPVEPGLNHVYPELIFLPFFRIGRAAIATATRILKNTKVMRSPLQDAGLTEHGKLRLEQRKISRIEIDEAIKTAEHTGNIITKTGKYGTPQNVYKGSNGVTVIQETVGRNAGKVITSWRH